MRAARGVALATITTVAALAYAATTGGIAATEPVTIVTVTSPTGSGSGSTSLQNTTSATTFNVLVTPDARCDPAVSFSVAGGNPIMGFAPGASRAITFQCPPRDDRALRRCPLKATNTATDAVLGDVTGVCLYGANPPTLTPLQTALDFGSLAVGTFAEQTLTIRNDGSTGAIRRVYLMTSDPAGHFQLTTPCNPDASYCDVDLTSDVAPGETFAIGVTCRPQSAGSHTAELYVGTDTFQLLSLGVTLSCAATASTQPALAIQPTTIELPAPIEVDDGTAQVTIDLANAGGGTLLVKDVRVVDVDTGAAEDWTYTASGTCSGQIASTCMLGPEDGVAIEVTFDPDQIGSRRAALLVTYQDTLDRTLEIPLDGSGQGATLRRLGPTVPLSFGSVPVGRSSTLDLTLVNDGNRDATATIALAPPQSPPFTTLPMSNVVVAPGTRRAIELTCAPQAAGAFATSVTLTSPDVASPLTVAATCEGTTNDLYAAPTALLVGEVRTNDAPRVLSVQLQSADGSPVAIAGEPLLETPNPAITLGPLSDAMTPATFTVTLAPQATGTLNGTIVVTAVDGEILRIPVSGSAVEATYITADTLDLGTFCVDQPTASSNVTLLSTGTATINVAPPALGKSPSPFDLRHATPSVYPHPLAPGRSAVVAVTPHRQRAAMTVADALTWQTDVPEAETATTALTARFIDSGGAIAPTALSFGEATVHLYADNGQRVVIQNCNPTPLVLDPPIIRSPFSIDSPGFPSMLSPNESVAFSVGFHPTRVGTVMDTLRITSPQLPGAPLEVTLVGTGSTGDVVVADAGIDAPDGGGGSCGCRSAGHPVGVLSLALVALALRCPRRRFGLR